MHTTSSVLRTTSEHVERLQTTCRSIWPQAGHRHTFRPALNVPALNELLVSVTGLEEPDVEEGESSEGMKGKKRMMNPAWEYQPNKRRRFNVEQLAAQKQIAGKKHEFKPSDGEYPLSEARRQEFSDPIPAIEHTYITTFAGCGKDAQRGAHHWRSEEDELRKTACKLRERGITSVKIGKLRIATHEDRVVAWLQPDQSYSTWFCLLPHFQNDIDARWNDLETERITDVMFCAALLNAVGRVAIDSNLQVTITEDSDDLLPVQLQLTVNIALDVDALSESSKMRNDKQFKPAEVEDAQRRLLDYISPLPTALRSTSVSSVTIPFFYSTLQPAPALDASIPYEVLQPPDLLPTLLPFQRRSVAWLLNREGKSITPEGRVISKSHRPATSSAHPDDSSDLSSYWQQVNLGNSTFYFNRLSGVVTTTIPDETEILGGILAEEPGLGKTLETISLVMMNPAPAERNHTVSRWDPEARLEVKATKVSCDSFILLFSTRLIRCCFFSAI
jgi:E3 ubiquitin-protein ligase SHPRH